MKGDRVEVLIDTGAGVRTFEVGATRAGRKLEVSVSRGTVEAGRGYPVGYPGANGAVHGQPGRRTGRTPGGPAAPCRVFGADPGSVTG